MKDTLYIVKRQTNPVITPFVIKEIFEHSLIMGSLFQRESSLEWHFWDLFRRVIFPNTMNTLHFETDDFTRRSVYQDTFYNAFDVASIQHKPFLYEDYVNDFVFTTYQENSSSDEEYEMFINLFEGNH